MMLWPQPPERPRQQNSLRSLGSLNTMLGIAHFRPNIIKHFFPGLEIKLQFNIQIKAAERLGTL